MDQQSRSGLCAQKKRREALIRLAATRSEWALSFADEVWWSRLAQPALHTWSLSKPVRLLEKETDKADTAPKALACYGLLLPALHRMLLRFVDGRPVSCVTCDFLAWVLSRLAAEGKQALFLIWDNASWHKSQSVRQWIKAHNRRVKQEGGCRLIVFRLPIKSPWRNPIEPKWVHGKRAVVEPARTLTANELMERVCAYYGCERYPLLSKKDS